MQGILSAIFFLSFGPYVVVSQGVRWSHLCTGVTRNLTCTQGSTIEITGVMEAYRALGCPDNLTDPVAKVADCSQRYAGENSFVHRYNRECNGTSMCTVDALSGNTVTGCNTETANFFSVNYTCHLHVGSTSPESSSPTTPTGNTNNTNSTDSSDIPVASPVTPTAAAASTGFPEYMIIPLAAGIGGAVLIVIVLFIVIFCKTRKSGDESIESPKERKESVAEVNINKVGDHRKRTAPRIKEAGRPDVTANTFTADETDVSYNPSDPRGLYAVPDKSGQSENLVNGKEDKNSLDPLYSDVHKKPKAGTKPTVGETSFSDITEEEQSLTKKADPPKIYQNTSFKGLPLHEADNDANKGIEDGLDNMGFVGDSGQYAEIPVQQAPDSADSEQRRVRFGGEEEIVGKGRESPDGLSDVDDGAKHRDKTATNDKESRKKVPSVVYAEVNKTPL